MSIKYIADLMLSTLYINYFFQKLNEKGKLQIKDKSISVNSTSNEDIKKKKEIELSDSTVTWFLKCSLESHHLHCFFID